MKNKPQLMLAIAVGLLLLLLATIRTIRVDQPESNPGEAKQQIVLSQPDKVEFDSEPEGNQQARRPITNAGPLVRQGTALHLYDAVFNYRITGEVFYASERITASIHPVGKFLLPPAESEGAIIEVFSHGYELQTIEYPTKETTKVLLQPSRESTVTVHRSPPSQGTITASILCPIEAPNPLPIAEKGDGEKKGDGVFAFHHATALLFRASMGGQAVERVVHPGDQIDLSFEEEAPPRLIVVDGDGLPVPGVPLLISSEEAGVVEAEYESDATGTIRLPGSLSRLPLWIRGNSRYWRLESQSLQPHDLFLYGSRARLEASTGAAQKVCIRRTYNDVSVIDASTKQPITGEGSLYRRFDSRNGRIEGFFHSSPIVDGRWRISYGDIRLAEPIHGVEEILRVAGYEAFVLEPDRSFLIDRQTDFGPVQLVPNSEQSWLRITRNGRPVDIGRVEVSKVGSRSHLPFVGTANKDGHYGPFEGGANVRVHSSRLGGRISLAADLGPGDDGNYGSPAPLVEAPWPRS